MITAYSIKKWASLSICSLIPMILFIVGDILKGLIWGIALFFLGMVLSLVASNLLIKNPFTNMLEGKGLIAVNLDSTGVLSFFNIRLENPRLLGKFYNQEIEDTFDRDAVFNFTPPDKKEGYALPTKDGGLIIKLNEKEVNKGRFTFMHYPLLIWNDQVKSLLTKDFFSDHEKHAFAEHQSLHLNQQMNGLTSTTRDFARYIVETLKPKMGFFNGKGGIIVIIIVVILIIILVALFAPKIIAMFGGGGGENVGAAVQKVSSKLQTINPSG